MAESGAWFTVYLKALWWGWDYLLTRSQEPIKKNVQPALIPGSHTVTCNWCHSLLKMLKSVDDIQSFSKLPIRLDTLKKNYTNSLPLMPTRSLKVKLDLSKIPTGSQLTCDVQFFDPTALVSAMLSSQDFKNKIHFGMAEIVEQQSELFHSMAYASSIRTTSGEFAHYPNDTALTYTCVLSRSRYVLRSSCGEGLYLCTRPRSKKQLTWHRCNKIASCVS